MLLNWFVEVSDTMYYISVVSLPYITKWNTQMAFLFYFNLIELYKYLNRLKAKCQINKEMKHIFASKKWLNSHYFLVYWGVFHQHSSEKSRTDACKSALGSEPHLPHYPNTNSQNALCLRLVWASVLQCPLHLPARTPSFPVSM